MTILALITWIGAVALGSYLLAIWLIEYAVPPERNFPVPVIVIHGLFGFTTITLVLLTALGVGSS